MPVSTRKHYPIQTMNRSHFAFTRHAPRAQGFSLVEMAMVLLVVGLLAALFLPATNTMMDNNRRKETRTKLESLESAITRFVMTTGRLPCPADGRLTPANANYGRELRTAATGVCTAITTGVVPWVTLGLPVTDALDAWNGLVSYRLRGDLAAGPNSVGLTVNRALDMTACAVNGAAATPATTETFDLHQRLGCAAGCDPGVPASCTGPERWLTGNARPLPALAPGTPRGMRICNATPCLPGDAAELAAPLAMTGAAYVLVSHGANRFGAYTVEGIFVANASGYGPGLRENINRNNLALRTAPNNDFYVDADREENAAAAQGYYDDIVLRPTVMKVILDAGLVPRSP